MKDPTAVLALRALVRNDEALLGHLADRIEATEDVAAASPLLARWHATGERLKARRQMLKSEVSLFLHGPVHTPAASHSSQVASVTGDAMQPDTFQPHL